MRFIYTKGAISEKAMLRLIYQARIGVDCMFDEGKSLARRFKQTRDIFDLCKKLEKENYTIEYGKDNTKINGEYLDCIRVLKDNKEKIKVLYLARNDDSNYKQYVYYMFF